MLLVRVPCRGALIGRRTPRPAPAVALYRVPTRSRDAASSTLTEGGVAREDAPVSLDAFVLFAEGEKKREGEFNDGIVERNMSRDLLSVSEGCRRSGMCSAAVVSYDSKVIN